MSNKNSRSSVSPAVSDRSQPPDTACDNEQPSSVAALSSAKMSTKRETSSPSGSESEVEDVSRKIKPSFSIQSILARPEPMRPSEHPLPYAHILQANFAHCFSHKFSGPALFYPWTMALQASHHDVPGMITDQDWTHVFCVTFLETRDLYLREGMRDFFAKSAVKNITTRTRRGLK